MGKKPTDQQVAAARLRDEGFGYQEIADKLGMRNRVNAQNCVRAYDARMEGTELKKKFSAPVPKTPEDKLEARIRSKKTKAGRPLKAETDASRVIRLMEEARVMALNFMDGETLAKETGRGLAQIVSILTDKIQLLKGEPTSISRVEDVRKMDDILAVLEAEMKNRGIKAEREVN